MACFCSALNINDARTRALFYARYCFSLRMKYYIVYYIELWDVDVRILGSSETRYCIWEKNTVRVRSENLFRCNDAFMKKAHLIRKESENGVV